MPTEQAATKPTNCRSTDSWRAYEKVNRRFLLINVGLLLCIAFVPFPTRLVAEHLRDEGAKAATLAYGLTLTITAIFFYLFWFVGVLRGGLLKPDADRKVVDGISKSYRPGTLMYGGATVVALFR